MAAPPELAGVADDPRAGAARQPAARAGWPGPLAVVMNAGSGHDEARERVDTITSVLAAAGRRHRLLPVTAGERLPAAIDEAIAFARAEGGAVVAAGGDGTLNTVAAAVLPTGLPFGALPQGTFNYFARDQGIPTDLAEGVRALLSSRPRPVPVGEVNGRLFLVNASIGLYPQLIEDREAFKQRFGRNRLVALASAAVTLLRESGRRELAVELAEARRTLHASTLFVGANALQLERLGLQESAAVEAGALAAVIVRPGGRLAMLGLMLRGALGMLEGSMAVDSFAFTRLTVQPAPGRRGRPVPVAIDGEVVRLSPPLAFARAARPLNLLLPETIETEIPGGGR